MIVIFFFYKWLIQGQSSHFDTNTLYQLPGLKKGKKSHKLHGLYIDYSKRMLDYQMEVKTLVILALLV